MCMCVDASKKKYLIYVGCMVQCQHNECELFTCHSFDIRQEEKRSEKKHTRGIAVYDECDMTTKLHAYLPLSAHNNTHNFIGVERNWLRAI